MSDSYKVPHGARCPYCGIDNDELSQAKDHNRRAPKPGDPLICFECAEIFTLSADGKAFVKLTEEQWSDLKRDGIWPQVEVFMIMNFDYPHRVGSVCRYPCVQCHETEDEPGAVSFEGGYMFPSQPLFIKREATLEEYKEYCAVTNCKLPPRDWGYCYEVSTD